MKDNKSDDCDYAHQANHESSLFKIMKNNTQVRLDDSLKNVWPDGQTFTKWYLPVGINTVKVLHHMRYIYPFTLSSIGSTFVKCVY